jgi:hypothetical protein
VLAAREAPARAPLFPFLDLRAQFAAIRPEAQRAASEVHALPICPELTEEQQAVVVQGIADLYRS